MLAMILNHSLSSEVVVLLHTSTLEGNAVGSYVVILMARGSYARGKVDARSVISSPTNLSNRLCSCYLYPGGLTSSGRVSISLEKGFVSLMVDENTQTEFPLFTRP